MWRKACSLALSLILALSAAPFSGVSASAAYVGEYGPAAEGFAEEKEPEKGGMEDISPGESKEESGPSDEDPPETEVMEDAAEDVISESGAGADIAASAPAAGGAGEDVAHPAREDGAVEEASAQEAAADAAEPEEDASGTDPETAQAAGREEVSAEAGAAEGEEEERNIWFEINDSRFFSDGEYDVELRTEGLGQPGRDYEVRLEVGHFDDQGMVEAYEEGKEYDYADGILTLHGGPIRERGFFWFGYRVQAVSTGDGEVLCADARNDLQSLEAREDYDREWDRDMLIGWDGSVSGRRNVRIENAQNPDGREEEYRVVDVEVEDDRPWDGEGGPVVVDFHRDQNEGDPENDYWWYYRVGHRGEAVLKVTYEDIDGREKDYEFTLFVGNDVYSVFMDSTGRERNAFPGGEIELFADASHEYYDEDGEYRSDREDLGYDWSFEYGGEFAEIEVHPDDPSRATLRFYELPEGEDWIDEDVRVGVRVLDDGGRETRAYDSTGFRVCTSYDVVWPFLPDWYMEAGESIEDEQFEVRRYQWGQDGCEVLDGRYEVAYEWYFDENAVEITEVRDGKAVRLSDGERAQGSVFTITRKKHWDTGFSVRASWTAEDGWHEAWTNYQLAYRNYDIQFENHDLDVYTDARTAPELVLFTDSLGDGWQDRMDLVVTAGRWERDEWEEVFDPDSDPAPYEVRVEGGRALVSLGMEKLAASGGRSVRVVAELYPKGFERTEENRITDTDAWFHIREARADYEREEDRDMLTGWGGRVDGFYNVYVENSECPDGRDEQYRVTNVEIADDRPQGGEEGPVVTYLQRGWNEEDPDGDYWWDYQVDRRGEADLKVTYLDLDGREQSYTFTLHVGDDVYSVYMDSTGRERNALPGAQIELCAEPFHEYYDENGEYHGDRDGLGCSWFFEYGGEYADILVHGDDPFRATLRFKALPEGEDEIDEDLRVAVRILDAQGGETGGYDSTGFNVRSEYREVWPLMLDRDLEVGGAIEDQDFEVRSFALGRDGYEVVDAARVRYEWHYDENALEVTEDRGGEAVRIPDGGSGEGSTFSILRKGDWNTGCSVRAVWTNWNGDEEDAWGDYQFRGRNYDWELEGGDEQEISDDEEKAFSIDDSRMEGFGGSFGMIVNFRAADGEADYLEQFEDLPEGERPRRDEDYVVDEEGAVYVDMTEGEEYVLRDGGRTIVVSGDMAERTIRKSICEDRRFRSEFYIGSAPFYQGEMIRDWRWCRVELVRSGKSMQDLSAGDVEITMFDSPVLAVSGAKGALSYVSSDEGVVKIGADGKLTPVSIGTAEVRIHAETTNDYRPGRTSCRVTVAKLDLAKAKVATNAPAKGYTYDGKAKKPSTVKVTYAGRTLKSGTDYKVSWPEDLVNAGTKTVTVTGKGSCAGTKKATFKIVKADQTITGCKASYSKTFGDKAFLLNAKAKTALAYKSGSTKVVKVSKTGLVTIVGAGKTTITVTADADANYNKASKKTITVTVAKAAPSFKIGKKSATFKASDLKKDAQSFSPKITVGSNGKLKFSKTSGSSSITVDSGTGDVTVAKKTKAGTYKIQLKAAAAAKGNYKAGSKTFTITVKVK